MKTVIILIAIMLLSFQYIATLSTKRKLLENGDLRPGWVNPNLPFWSSTNPAGQTTPPLSPFQKSARFWPMFFFDFKDLTFRDKQGNQIDFDILDPKNIDFQNEQLPLVKEALANCQTKQIINCQNWNVYATFAWVPIVNQLFAAYNVNYVYQSRILSYLYALEQDVVVITWYYKFLWDVPRANQLDQTLKTMICTAQHPSYPGAHATTSGSVGAFLTYLFPGEAARIDALVVKSSEARIEAGVHYPIDCKEGIKLGKQIAQVVINQMKLQKDENGNNIDLVYPPIDFNPHLHVLRNHDNTCGCSTLIDSRTLQVTPLE